MLFLVKILVLEEFVFGFEEKFKGKLFFSWGFFFGY